MRAPEEDEVRSLLRRARGEAPEQPHLSDIRSLVQEYLARRARERPKISFSLQGANEEVPAMSETFLAAVEGPHGQAVLYELANTLPSGVLAIQFQVRYGGQVQTYPTLGEAYIDARELTGARI